MPSHRRSRCRSLRPRTLSPAARLGGPLSVAASEFHIDKYWDDSLGWALGGNSSWLNASPGSGTLAPGGPAATVTLSLNSAAGNLPAGSHAATIWFTNLNDGFVQSRQLILDVVVPPIINQQPASQSVPLGGTATFTVGTASNALLFFQWQDNGANLTDGGNISGSAGSTLIISNVNAATSEPIRSWSATPQTWSSAWRCAHHHIVRAGDPQSTRQPGRAAGSDGDFHRGGGWKRAVVLSMAMEHNEFDRWRQCFRFRLKRFDPYKPVTRQCRNLFLDSEQQPWMQRPVPMPP